MALDPSTSYPAQIDTSDPTGYPYGAAINESAPGANDGTPLEESWLKDLWGFLQAILSGASIVPSGIADKVGASQHLTALRVLFLDALNGGTVAGPVEFADDVELDADLLVDGVATFDGAVDFNSGLEVAAGFATFADGVGIAGVSGLSAPLVCSGTGRIRPRVTTGADADTTYNVSTVDIIYVPTLTGIRDYTLGDTGASNGDLIAIAIAPGITDYIVPKRSDTTQIDDILIGGDSGTSATHRYAQFIRVSGQWELLHGEPAPDLTP